MKKFKTTKEWKKFHTTKECSIECKKCGCYFVPGGLDVTDICAGCYKQELEGFSVEYRIEQTIEDIFTKSQKVVFKTKSIENAYREIFSMTLDYPNEQFKLIKASWQEEDIMATTREIVEGLKIITGTMTEEELDGYNMTANDDELFCGDYDPAKMTQKELKTLKKLGWFEDEDSWAIFT